MAKSLTETAMAVINGQAINESNDAAPDRDAKKMTPNAATLKPGSKGAEGKFANPGSMAPDTSEMEDLGPALVSPTGQDGPSKASARMKKVAPRMADKAGKPEASAKAEMMEEDIELEEEDQIDEVKHSKKKMDDYNMENDEKMEMDEEFELDEELETFIDNLVAEGLSEDEIVTAIEENFEFINEEDDSDYQVDMSEHVNALLEGENLSEEFKAKATTIFESAVKLKVEEEIAAIEQAFAATLEEEVAKIQEQLANNVDDYLNYVVENWIAENDVAIEAGLRTELTEDFISGLRNLFAENYIDIPEDKINVIEELTKKVDELEVDLNEEIERNVTLNKMLSENKRVEILNSSIDGLTDTQAEKLKSLAEGIEYKDENLYADKIKTLRENYFPTSIKASELVDTEEKVADGRALIAEEIKGPMDHYVKVLGRKLPN